MLGSEIVSEDGLSKRENNPDIGAVDCGTVGAGGSAKSTPPASITWTVWIAFAKINSGLSSSRKSRGRGR
jgi:hypothetical protein